MKRFLVALSMISVMFIGCTGSFMLTKEVYDFHRDRDEKWVDELIFLGCVILPVYSLATLGDAIILNSVEFWTGDNPMAKTTGPQDEIMVSYNAENDSIMIEGDDRLILQRGEAGVTASDTSGKVLYIAQADPAGGVFVYDAGENLIRHFPAHEVMNTKLELLH